MILYGATLFLSAFLLFVVQPMMGKYILPLFGGSPTVWTTCMLFFQVLLLVGYAYAHWISVHLPVRRQVLVHLLFIAAALLTLPVAPSAAWKPDAGGAPVPRILTLLGVSIGTSYLMLSASGPLLQSWLARIEPTRSPYPLYSLSNLGSLLALLSYPFLIEPTLRLRNQAQFWSWGYLLFGLLTVLCTTGLIRRSAVKQPDLQLDAGESTHVTPGNRLLWVLLATSSSVMLLATTNQLSQDVAVVPLLWIVPLALYLLTFILCFYRKPLYSRGVFMIALAAALAQACYVLYEGVFLDIRLQILSYSFTLFVCCMVCHGEVVRLKPPVRHLTAFYLLIAAGGAFGGILVTAGAPRVFPGYWEYPLALISTALLLLVVMFRDPHSRLYHGRLVGGWALLAAAVTVLSVSLAIHVLRALEDSVARARNFFGVLRVLEEDIDNPDEHRYVLMHGRIEHGFQYVSPEKRFWPTSYFGPNSGVGLAIRFHPKREMRSAPLRVGVVGLGTGTLATYGEPGEYFRFYEINPEVVRLAGRYFSYRQDSGAQVDVILGDARVSMEREMERGESQQFDVLAVDAFASDAIPVHLLTHECYRIYRYHLRDDGILALHISSRYFELGPVVRSLATQAPDASTEALWITARGSTRQGTDSTDWVLLTSNKHFLACDSVMQAVKPWPAGQQLVPWTDDYTNIFKVLQPRTRY
jgi:hypothetical protein